MKLKILLLLPVILLFIVSWTLESENYNNRSDDICFEVDVLPIFLENCALSGCHNSESRKEGVVLDSYENIMNSKKGRAIIPYNLKRSKVYKKITEDTREDRMPPLPNEALTASEISVIGQWISAGAPNSKCEDRKIKSEEKTDSENSSVNETFTDNCDTLNLKYKDIQPIIENNCYKCHSGNLPDELFNLETYSQIKKKGDEGKLYGAVNHLTGFKPMPRKSPKLSGCDLIMINAWINNGMQE